MLSVSIQPCTPKQLPLVRTVLQLPLAANLPYLHLWLALGTPPAGGGSPQILGAAALQGDSIGGRVWLTVLPAHRHQGVGRQLFATVKQKATELGMPQLQTWEGLEQSAEAFVLGQGFSFLHEIEAFEAPFSQTLAYFGTLMQWLERRNSIPGSLQHHWYQDVPWGNLRRLLDSCFGFGIRQQVIRLIANGLQPNEWVYAVTHNQAFLGGAIGSFAEHIVRWDAYAVEPAYRRSWVHVALRYWVLREVQATRPEITTVQFEAGPDFSDTLKMAARIGATSLNCRRMYALKV